MWLVSFMLVSVRWVLRVLGMTREVSLMPLCVARPVMRPQNRNMKLTLAWWHVASRPGAQPETLPLLTTIRFEAPALTFFRTPSIADPFVLDVLRTTVSLFRLTTKEMPLPVATAADFTRQSPASPPTLTHVTPCLAPPPGAYVAPARRPQHMIKAAPAALC